MAKLVQIIGVSHNPTVPARFGTPGEADHPGIPKAKERFRLMRGKLAEARPDVVLVIGNDHLNQLFMDNLPAFIIAKPDVMAGPPEYEVANWGMPRYRVPVDVGLAKAFIRRGFEEGVDFAFSDEFTVDHSIVLPLHLTRPEADLPVVPLITNVMAEPVAPARRFYQVGEALRRIIDGLPDGLRVAVVASGHLSTEVGAPKTFKRFLGEPDGCPDREFDEQALNILKKGDSAALLSLADPERMRKAGNFTSGFLNFVLLSGMARGKAATQAEGVLTDTVSLAFLTWDLHKEAA